VIENSRPYARGYFLLTGHNDGLTLVPSVLSLSPRFGPSRNTYHAVDRQFERRPVSPCRHLRIGDPELVGRGGSRRGVGLGVGERDVPR
jgi:hypothetical protein